MKTLVLENGSKSILIIYDEVCIPFYLLILQYLQYFYNILDIYYSPEVEEGWRCLNAMTQKLIKYLKAWALILT
jgi:hypothetical protein